MEYGWYTPVRSKAPKHACFPIAHLGLDPVIDVLSLFKTWSRKSPLFTFLINSMNLSGLVCIFSPRTWLEHAPIVQVFLHTSQRQVIKLRPDMGKLSLFHLLKGILCCTVNAAHTISKFRMLHKRYITFIILYIKMWGSSFCYSVCTHITQTAFLYPSKYP